VLGDGVTAASASDRTCAQCFAQAKPHWGGTWSS
jgi:hypothetical protein